MMLRVSINYRCYNIPSKLFHEKRPKYYMILSLYCGALTRLACLGKLTYFFPCLFGQGTASNVELKNMLPPLIGI